MGETNGPLFTGGADPELIDAEGDELDGCAVVLDGDPERVCPDDGIDALCLFADVDFTDPDAVARRRAEWVELFPLDPVPEVDDGA